jgi:hypothetical protein
LITVVEENLTSLEIELISSRSVTSEIKAKAGKTLKLLYFKNHRKYKLRFSGIPRLMAGFTLENLLVLHLDAIDLNGIVATESLENCGSNFILHSGRWSL